MNRFLACFAVAIVAAFWPVWRWYGLRMTDGSDEPMGLFALVVGIGFLWYHRKLIKPTKVSVSIGIVFLLGYIFVFHELPRMISAILMLGALAGLSGTIFRLPAVWAILCLSLPVLASFQFYLGYPMRMIAAVFTEYGLRLLQFDIQRTGTDLIYQNEVVGVDPPCSGIEMLWVGIFIMLLPAAFYRWSFGKTLLNIVIGVVGVIFANSLRVTLLFFKESGLVDLPAWTHEGIGIAIFVLLIWLVGRGDDEVFESRASPEPRFRPFWPATIITLLAIASVIPLVGSDRNLSASGTEKFPGWPAEYQGKVLEPVPLSAAELSFASSFPGQIGVFIAGNDKIIMRWVKQPTRKLHPSSDCLRAAGYDVEMERAGRFVAFSDDGEYGWYVEESIFNDVGDQWKEVTSWFWSAFMGKTTGPWWAVTRISPLAY